MQKNLIALAVVVIIGAGVFVLSKDDDRTTSNNASQNTSQSTNTNKSEDGDTHQEGEHTDGVITYNSNGFSPKTLTVKSGDTVTIKNDSSSTIQFNSDPHPAHTTNTELNVDTIRAGQSKSFKVSRTGTFGYHDHLDPRQTGTIIVE